VSCIVFSDHECMGMRCKGVEQSFLDVHKASQRLLESCTVVRTTPKLHSYTRFLCSVFCGKAADDDERYYDDQRCYDDE
jgi:hypothetical protein